MATAIQRRRGTTVQHQTFTGQVAEITVDTTKKTAVIHDGVTAGGFPLAREDNVDAAVAALDSAKLDKTGGTITGNVIVEGASWKFAGVATRIRGDFGNATIANRTMFQTSQTDSYTVVEAIPSGTSSIALFGVSTNSADPENCSVGQMRIGLDVNEFRIVSNKRGTGAYLPLTFHTGGYERVRITANGDTRPYYTNTPTVAAGNSFSYNVDTHGQVCLVTVSGAGTITFGAPSNITEGAMYKFLLKAGDTSSRTFAWNAAFKFPDAVSPLTSGDQTLGAVDIINFTGGASNTLLYDGHQAGVR